MASAGLLLYSGCSTNKTTESAARTRVGDQATTSPSGTEAKQADRALVRFVNAAPTSEDIYFGDIPAFTSVSFGTVTPYKELPAERRDFKLMPAGSNSGQPLASNSEGLSAGKHYTVLAVTDRNGKANLNVVNDDLSAPPAGKAKVRVLNAAPGMGDVDLYARGTKNALISGAGFNHATNYKEVDPITTELDIRGKGGKKNETPVQQMNLAPDKSYTIIVMGGEGQQPVTAKTVEDQLVGPVAETRSPTDTRAPVDTRSPR